MSAKIIDEIYDLKTKVAGDIERFGILGSWKDNTDDFNDIDLAIFIKPENEYRVIDILQNASLSMPLYIQPIGRKYERSASRKTSEHYHVMLLNNEDPDEKFMQYCQGKITYL
ncbi:hypothetical protein ACFL9T_21665 [Thermodesulfobacteriota bacterium]